jgi:hypothetical protein
VGVAEGGFFTDEELDSLIAVLEEHFLDPETATLEEAKQVLGLTTEQHVRERRAGTQTRARPLVLNSKCPVELGKGRYARRKEVIKSDYQAEQAGDPGPRLSHFILITFRHKVDGKLTPTFWHMFSLYITTFHVKSIGNWFPLPAVKSMAKWTAARFRLAPSFRLRKWIF